MYSMQLSSAVHYLLLHLSIKLYEGIYYNPYTLYYYKVVTS